MECVMESHRRNTGLKTQKPIDKSTKPKKLKNWYEQTKNPENEGLRLSTTEDVVTVETVFAQRTLPVNCQW